LIQSKHNYFDIIKTAAVHCCYGYAPQLSHLQSTALAAAHWKATLGKMTYITFHNNRCQFKCFLCHSIHSHARIFLKRDLLAE